MDKETKVYIIDDVELIDFIEDNDVQGFQDCLDSDDTYYFREPITFSTDIEAEAFACGYCCGFDERYPKEKYALLDSDPEHIPFINAIKNY